MLANIATSPRITMVLAAHGAKVMAKAANNRSRFVSKILVLSWPEHYSRNQELGG